MFFYKKNFSYNFLTMPLILVHVCWLLKDHIKIYLWVLSSFICLLLFTFDFIFFRVKTEKLFWCHWIKNVNETHRRQKIQELLVFFILKKKGKYDTLVHYKFGPKDVNKSFWSKTLYIALHVLVIKQLLTVIYKNIVSLGPKWY
jgi:hypothetical protein